MFRTSDCPQVLAAFANSTLSNAGPKDNYRNENDGERHGLDLIGLQCLAVCGHLVLAPRNESAPTPASFGAVLPRKRTAKDSLQRSYPVSLKAIL